MLNEKSKPPYTPVYTWFAMDKLGKVAFMFNNTWGDLPKVLKKGSADEMLDNLVDYVYEESSIYHNYPKRKNANFQVDLYSEYMNNGADKKSIIEYFQARKNDNYLISHADLSQSKGLFIYYAVEGSYEGEDYPVGYDGKTKMGDYYRFLMPTIYASIEDFPEELRPWIVVSDTVDFTVDQVLDNDLINEYFPKLYRA